MNDEQQLWRDFQKFLKQFPGIVAVAKKIGEIGDLEAWQNWEQRKLDNLKAEAERQREQMAGELVVHQRELANKQREMDERAAAHADKLKSEMATAHEMAKEIHTKGTDQANAAVAEAQARVNTLKEEFSKWSTRKGQLGKEIEELEVELAQLKNDHAETHAAFVKVKEDSAAFLRKMSGVVSG